MVAITTPLVTNSGVNDIFITEDRYALMTTGSGVDVLDLFCGQVISSGTLPDTLCITADPTSTFGQVYVGTAASGIYSMKYNNVRIVDGDFTDSLIQRYNQDSVLGLTGDQVNDLCALPDRLMASTSGGVDFITTALATDGEVIEELRAYRTQVSGVSGCYMTVAGEGYWSVNSSGIEANYDLFSTSGTGIINVDFAYTTASVPALPSSGVNDFVVEEDTRNLLGIATISGDLIIQEEQGAESTALAKTLFPATNVISIDFSDPVVFSGGLAYVALEGAVSIVGMSDSAISGTHYADADILLGQTNSGDQSLVSGTNTIIRTTSVA